MSLEDKALALAGAVGTDIKKLLATVGTFANLSNLTTENKTDLVSALNELQTELQVVLDLQAVNNASIDDTAGVGVVNKVWSADKLVSAIAALKSEIIDGAPEAYDSLQEIAAYLAANTNNINDLLLNLSGTVRVDEIQDLTTVQQQQACTNINVGNKEVQLRDIYLTAKDTNTYITPGYVEPGYVA